MSESTNAISDLQFLLQLREVKSIKQFLFEERVPIGLAKLQSIDLGSLNVLTYGKGGRAPSTEEWSSLDEKLSALTDLLDQDQRWKLRIRELSLFFRTLPLVFLMFSVLIVIFYMVYPKFVEEGSTLKAICFLFCLLAWAITQGALGACAFLGVSAGNRVSSLPAGGSASSTALIALADIPDLTNRNLMTIRIVLGAVFAFLFGVPISYVGLEAMRKSFELANTTPDSASSVPDAATYTLIVAPFLFGFSTSLVLALLSRLLDSIKTFFGISKSSTTQ